MKSQTPSLDFQRSKVDALAVNDLTHAGWFHGETLGLPPAYKDSEKVDCLLGQTIACQRLIGMHRRRNSPTHAPYEKLVLLSYLAKSSGRCPVALGSILAPLLQKAATKKTLWNRSVN